MIPVTKPFLPPREEYEQYLDGIWKRNWLTNNGPLVNGLEISLKRYLQLDHLLFLGNGTIAIQLAIKALGLKGEIITTPFSYIATSSSIVWENCVPVFVDIDSQTLNIDASKIEDKITANTSAILATHVFGNPCEVETISTVADKHNVKVIYDAAHAFGVMFKGKSLLTYGDISTLSFHATKIFHTIEGGAVITKSPQILQKLASMRNFGHSGPESFSGLGINAKNSEFHAAMGLCNLKYVEDIIDNRKQICGWYDERLNTLEVEQQNILDKEFHNYAYYPIIFKNEDALLRAKKRLELANIFPRRYFYPTLSSLAFLGQSHETPIANSIAKRILCLPLYYGLTQEEVYYIARLLLRVQNYS